ncbi:MAG: hypothetical protein ABWK53_09615 [Anaerolineales bacterium]
MLRLTVPYRSGWFTVVLPVVLFLLIWIGGLIGIVALTGWEMPNWAGLLTCAGTLALGLISAVLTYPWMERLAARGRGEVILEGNHLRWRTGRRWREVDLSREYEAEIAAGPFLHISVEGQSFLLRGALTRQDVLRLFPEPDFVSIELAGNWGFEFPKDMPQAVPFFEALLETLWRRREQNRYYRLFSRFPWQNVPRPDVHFIRFVPSKDASAVEKGFVERLQRQFLDSLTSSYVRVTPDYLVGLMFRPPLKGGWSAQPDSWCLMPLGYVRAEATLEHLIVRGQDEKGQPVDMQFPWYNLDNANLTTVKEAGLVVRFIQAMWERVHAGHG